MVVLQVYGVTAAVGHIAFNWDAYMRATARTRPLAVAAIASTLTFFAAGIPLLFAYGLRGFAYGVALQLCANLVVRAYYLRQLFEGFSFLRQAMRAIVPTIPPVVLVLVARLVETGPRTAGQAAAELVLYGIATVIGTWLFEGRLIREAVSYLVSRRAAALTG